MAHIPCKQPKYSFGLLETPNSCGSSSETGTWRTGRSGSSNSSSSDLISSSSTPHTPYRPMGRSRGARTPSTTTSARSRTPGSSTPSHPSSATPSDHSSVIVALVEGRGLARGEIGMASIDLKRPVLTLSQFSDGQTYGKLMTKLHILNPIEILMTSTVCENGNTTKLFKIISDHYNSTNIAGVQRKYFNETKGFQYIKQLCLPEFNTVEMEIRSKYYCLATAAALLKYIEFIQDVVYAPASLKIIFTGSEQTTMIDATTAMNLELILNKRDPRSENSLYGVLNYTKTSMGARLLRSNILQPPFNEETITKRLDAVGELTAEDELFYSVQAVLARFIDLDHLLALCVQIPKQETIKTAESKIQTVIQLKHVLQLVEPLRTALQTADSTLLAAYSTTLVDPQYALLTEKLSTVIDDDTRFQKGALNMRTQKCFAVRQNLNGRLDVARRTYTEIIDDVAELISGYAEQQSLPLRTGHSAARGYHVQLYVGGKGTHPTPDTLPGLFIKVVKFRNTLSFTTSDLIKLNDRMKESLHEIYLMSNVVVTELLVDVREHMGCLYKLSECVAMLDMLVSFAHMCTLNECVRPVFTDTLAIKQGRHPILDRISITPPVPNNVYASEQCNFILITGPNMSGKSTYLRQMALLQVLAQIGCHVPAEYAAMRLTDQVFTRIGSDDDIETNASTFMLEMREINYIIQNASSCSLIIIDELGRGTSAEEGVGLCHAICEYLLNLKAFTFFATHFTELTSLGSLYPNVETYHFDVLHSTDGTTYTHVLSTGKSKHTHYGLQLAEVSTLPRSVISKAKEFCAFLEKQKQQSVSVSAESIQQRAVCKLAQRLVQTAQNSRLDAAALGQHLHALRTQYCTAQNGAQVLSTTGEE